MVGKNKMMETSLLSKPKIFSIVPEISASTGTLILLTSVMLELDMLKSLDKS